MEIKRDDQGDWFFNSPIQNFKLLLLLVTQRKELIKRLLKFKVASLQEREALFKIHKDSLQTHRTIEQSQNKILQTLHPHKLALLSNKQLVTSFCRNYLEDGSNQKFVNFLRPTQHRYHLFNKYKLLSLIHEKLQSNTFEFMSMFRLMRNFYISRLERTLKCSSQMLNLLSNKAVKSSLPNLNFKSIFASPEELQSISLIIKSDLLSSRKQQLDKFNGSQTIIKNVNQIPKKRFQSKFLNKTQLVLAKQSLFQAEEKIKKTPMQQEKARRMNYELHQRNKFIKQQINGYLRLAKEKTLI